MGGDLCGWLAYFALLSGPVATPRYRLPMEPVLIVLAAIPLASVVRNMSISRLARSGAGRNGTRRPMEKIATLIKSLVHRSLAALGYRLERIPRRPPAAAQTIGKRDQRSSAGDHDAILRTATAHLENSTVSADLPSLGHRWGAYASQLRARIGRLSTVEDLIHLSQSPEAGIETHFPPHELMGHCHACDLDLLADLPSDIYAAFSSFRSPKIIRPDCIVEYRGRTIDFTTLLAARTVLTLLKLLRSNWPSTICDIGGGTGSIARCWLQNSAHRPDLVVIIDIPESLVYSEALLRSELGESQVQYIAGPACTPQRSGVVLCPIGYTRTLENISFDLVTNTTSMQEMTDAWIDWYMAWLDRQQCRFFWSANHFANSLSNMREGHNSWSPRPSPRWQLLYSKVHVGPRNSAHLLFQKDAKAVAGEPAGVERKGLEVWLAYLELARRISDEPSLRRALEFASSNLPFMPKEAWQLSKMLLQITGAPQDKEFFEKLDQMRKAGNEAAH